MLEENGQGRLGSSPLARGTHVRPRRMGANRRFIPARAGNTEGLPRHPQASPVHPRSRGEHPGPGRYRLDTAGSSPLARGTHLRSARRRPEGRFIPARAGNTATSRPKPASLAVHPRSRGEHEAVPPPYAAFVGSSPLARGTLRRPFRARGHLRFIPARAGNTTAARTDRPRSPVHPRSRGEHLTAMMFPPQPAGSSPLARGTPRLRPIGSKRRRFIPARAGNTPG